MTGKQQGGNGGGDDEPSHEQVKRLESIEPHAGISSKSMRGEKHDGGNDAEYRDIAEDRGGPIADAVKEVAELSSGAGLRRSAVITEGRARIHASPAIGAKRQNRSLLISSCIQNYAKAQTFVPESRRGADVGWANLRFQEEYDRSDRE